MELEMLDGTEVYRAAAGEELEKDDEDEGGCGRTGAQETGLLVLGERQRWRAQQRQGYS